MTQANAVPTTILRPPAHFAPAVFYIPEIHHNSRGGNYFPELNLHDTTKATIVANIASAEHEDVSRVIAFDVAAGTSWDASKEIASLVLDQVIAEYGKVPAWCVDFLEENLGVGFVRQCEREAA